MANVTGWGRSTWGSGEWGEAVPVTLTGLSATSGLGSLSVDAEANISLASQVGTSALGTATTVSNNNISVTGLSVTSAVSGVGVNGQAVASVPSVVATLGSVSVDVDGEANVTVTGVAATSAIGTATTTSNNNFDVGNQVNQMVANDPFVNPTFICKANVSVTGVSATGVLSTLNIWSPVKDEQTPNWRNVAA